MLLDNIKRILSGDFQDDHQETVGKLAEVLNYFMEQVTNTVNGGLSYDNMNKEVQTIEVTVNANGVPTAGDKFASNQGLIGTNIINTVNLTNNSVFPESLPHITWTTVEAGIYTIRNITGLQANNKYRLTVELIF